MNFFTTIVICLILGFIIYSQIFNKKAIVKRKLKTAPLKKLSTFRTGDIAKITGKVELIGDPLIAPLSQRECAYYHVVVKRERSSKNGSHMETIIDDEKFCGFVINDSGFYAYVKGTDLSSYIVKDREFESGFLNDATSVLERFLKSHDESSENWFGLNKKLEYKEGILEVGEKIAVLGQGKWQHASSVGLPEKYGDILVMGPMGDKPIYLSDDPNTLMAKKNR